MFVWGDQDPLVPLAFSQYVAEALPNSRQIVLEECGHIPQVELPEHANSAIHHFIGEGSASAAARVATRIAHAARRLRAARAA
jgi:pimeloyl-ACP methyl ester carboxylesterase